MSAATRPDLLGYYSIKVPAISAATEDAMRQRFVHFAEVQRYTLQGVYAETVATGTGRISALIDRAGQQTPVATVAVLRRSDIPSSYRKLLDDAGIAIVVVPAGIDVVHARDAIRREANARLAAEVTS